MKKTAKLLPVVLTAAALLLAAQSLWPYKSRPWSPRSRSSYAARLESEQVVIAVEPLFTDKLAASVFDKKDMITRGIMPLVVAIFNDNDFPVEVEGASIELIGKDRRLCTLSPDEALKRIFKPAKSWIKSPVPRLAEAKISDDAIADFESKFLRNKIIPPHASGGGFLYMPVPEGEDIVEYLLKSKVYIPNIFRRDNRSRMIFFEIDLDGALTAIQ